MRKSPEIGIAAARRNSCAATRINRGGRDKPREIFARSSIDQSGARRKRGGGGLSGARADIRIGLGEEEALARLDAHARRTRLQVRRARGRLCEGEGLRYARRAAPETLLSRARHEGMPLLFYASRAELLSLSLSLLLLLSPLHLTRHGAPGPGGTGY